MGLMQRKWPLNPILNGLLTFSVAVPFERS